MISVHPALLVAVLTGSGLSGPSSIQRHFHYPATQFIVHSSHDTASVTVGAGISPLVSGPSNQPLIAERVELPPGTRIRRVAADRVGWAPLATTKGAKSEAGNLPDAGESASGENPVVQVGYQGSMRGKKVAWLMVRPLRWRATTGRLDRVTDLDLRLELESDPTDVVTRERVVSMARRILDSSGL